MEEVNYNAQDSEDENEEEQIKEDITNILADSNTERKKITDKKDKKERRDMKDSSGEKKEKIEEANQIIKSKM